ncbi:uncharacterized protein LOC105695049 [Orussus abietinus]|uniref:uncharacterized protein LOC105695049 n=1 Tax=Orussus abietinus TaxID=222816 RepID=UPI000626C62A|nr:uncharacterized protein LOC105695049 [Orussus abietinus]
MDADRRLEEDRRPLLGVAEVLDGFPGRGVREAAVAQGVVRFLGEWPGHVQAALSAACLLLAALLLLGLVVLALAAPGPGDERGCRRTRDLGVGDGPLNVYFLKHANRTWSREELCRVETAARHHPDAKVYLIGLQAEEPSRRRPNLGILSNDSSEERLRVELARRNLNLENLDLVLERFFRGSKLSDSWRNMSLEDLETAARAHVLWNSPGIALDPGMYFGLKHARRFLCDVDPSSVSPVVQGDPRGAEDCKPDKRATIGLGGDLQATGVPCQAFLGFLIGEMSKTRSASEKPYTLKQAAEEFCSKMERCPEVRMVDLGRENTSEVLSCPSIFPEKTSTDLSLVQLEIGSRENHLITTR